MKNIYEVLRQKELELQQLQKEIEALRVAARLLADDNEIETVPSRPVSSGVPAPRISAAVSVASVVRPAETLSPSPVVRQFP
jgi:hypothetical protein